MPNLRTALYRRGDVDAESASPAAQVPPKRLAPLRVVEAVLAVGIAACVLIVHDVPYLLRMPYWVDEAWVAVSTRGPLGDLMTVTSSSPVGWTFLLRLVPGGGQQDQRLLVLFFAALMVIAAYEFGRSLGLLPVVTGIMTGGAALLVPAMLVSAELKQYTADAFVALLVLTLVSRLEASWSRRRLVTMSVTLVVMAFVSDVTLFVAAAALPCVALAMLARRRWPEFREAVVATVATGVLLGAVYLIFDGGTRTGTLKAYWSAYYLPHSFSGAVRYINNGLHRLLPYFGFGHLFLLVALVLLGLGVIVWQGRWATAAVVPVLSVELVVLSALQKYPLLDQRTSTFLITTAAVLAAVGVAGVATLLARRVHLAAGIALAALGAALYIPGTLNYVGAHPLPLEDVRAQANYVATHERPGDAVLVSYGAGWGYGYYAPVTPELVRTGGIGFSVAYPQGDGIVVLENRRPVDVQSGITRAWAMVSGHPGARLWIVLNHVAAGEAAAWSADLAPLSPQRVYVGPGTFVDYAVVRA